MTACTFSDVVLGNRDGYVALAFGRHPYWTETGKYKHREWSETRFKWPAERDQMAVELQQETFAGDPVDVYVCPAIRFTDDRRKGSALPPMVCWVDLDNEPIDTALWDTLAPFVVASGQPGHRHGYIPLTEPANLGLHAQLNRALRDRLGGDHKWSDQVLLRLPGTFNHKPSSPPNTGQPALVTVESTIPVVWTPDDLAALLGVGDHEIVTTSDESSDAEAEPVDLDALPVRLRERLADPSPPDDRSAVFHGLVGGCRDAGLSKGQTATVMAAWQPGRDKYRDRLAGEVARSWGKVDNKTISTSANNTMSISSNGIATNLVDDLREGMHHGQLRMAYRLANSHHRHKLVHVHGVGWHQWDGKRWAYDDQGHAVRAVRQVLRKALESSLDLETDAAKAIRRDVDRCSSATGAAGVLALAATMAPFAATVRDLDSDPYLLNCANGTLDLRTLQLRPHDPSDRITRITVAAYDETADAAVWNKFLDRVLPDVTVREFLKRLAGVALLGRVVEHVLGILTGTGANGKGVFTRAVEHAFGDYAATAEADLFMAREGAHPTGEMDLLGRRWVTVSETDQGRRLAEATMKRLTGGDTIKARRMRQDFVEFQPSHTAVLVTNHLPAVRGDDPAIWRRIRVVPFDVVIPEAERDKHLDERLQLQAEAVLAWAVAGYRDYANRGDLGEPQAVSDATSTYRLDSDPVARFIDEECVVKKQGHVAMGDLFARWQEWAVEEDVAEMSQKAFGQALDRKGYESDKYQQTRIRRGLILAAKSRGDES